MKQFNCLCLLVLLMYSLACNKSKEKSLEILPCTGSNIHFSFDSVNTYYESKALAIWVKVNNSSNHDLIFSNNLLTDSIRNNLSWFIKTNKGDTFPVCMLGLDSSLLIKKKSNIPIFMYITWDEQKLKNNPDKFEIKDYITKEILHSSINYIPDSSKYGSILEEQKFTKSDTIYYLTNQSFSMDKIKVVYHNN